MKKINCIALLIIVFSNFVFSNAHCMNVDLDALLEWGTTGLRITQNKIEKLDLSNKKINAAGAFALSLVLRKNDSLTHINLSNNKLGNEGLSCIIDSLCDHPKISYLNISGNQISNEGFEHLVELRLKNDHSLFSLNVSRNNLTIDSILTSVDFIKQHKKLKKINFSNNSIEDETWFDTSKIVVFSGGIRAMKDDEETPISLETLLFYNNKLSFSAKTALLVSGVDVKY